MEAQLSRHEVAHAFLAVDGRPTLEKPRNPPSRRPVPIIGQSRTQTSTGSIKPGTAEFVLSQLGHLGLGCTHYPKSHDPTRPNHQYPQRLGFFESAKPDARGPPRILLLQTSRFCISCLDGLIPNGTFNFWSLACSLSNKTRGWLSAAPADASAVAAATIDIALYPAGRDTFALFSSSQGTTTHSRPCLVSLPDLPGVFDMWDWLLKERKPFYLDQLHLDRGWLISAELNAESDSNIVNQLGNPYPGKVEVGVPSSTSKSTLKTKKVSTTAAQSVAAATSVPQGGPVAQDSSSAEMQAVRPTKVSSQTKKRLPSNPEAPAAAHATSRKPEATSMATREPPAAVVSVAGGLLPELNLVGSSLPSFDMMPPSKPSQGQTKTPTAQASSEVRSSTAAASVAILPPTTDQKKTKKSTTSADTGAIKKKPTVTDSGASHTLSGNTAQPNTVNPSVTNGKVANTSMQSISSTPSVVNMVQTATGHPATQISSASQPGPPLVKQPQQQPPPPRPSNGKAPTVHTSETTVPMQQAAVSTPPISKAEQKTTVSDPLQKIQRKKIPQPQTDEPSQPIRPPSEPQAQPGPSVVKKRPTQATAAPSSTAQSINISSVTPAASSTAQVPNPAHDSNTAPTGGSSGKTKEIRKVSEKATSQSVTKNRERCNPIPVDSTGASQPPMVNVSNGPVKQTASTGNIAIAAISNAGLPSDQSLPTAVRPGAPVKKSRVEGDKNGPMADKGPKLPSATLEGKTKVVATSEGKIKAVATPDGKTKVPTTSEGRPKRPSGDASALPTDQQRDKKSDSAPMAQGAVPGTSGDKLPSTQKRTDVKKKPVSEVSAPKPTQPLQDGTKAASAGTKTTNTKPASMVSSGSSSGPAAESSAGSSAVVKPKVPKPKTEKPPGATPMTKPQVAKEPSSSGLKTKTEKPQDTKPAKPSAASGKSSAPSSSTATGGVNPAPSPQSHEPTLGPQVAKPKPQGPTSKPQKSAPKPQDSSPKVQGSAPQPTPPSQAGPAKVKERPHPPAPAPAPGPAHQTAPPKQPKQKEQVGTGTRPSETKPRKEEKRPSQASGYTSTNHPGAASGKGTGGHGLTQKSESKPDKKINGHEKLVKPHKEQGSKVNSGHGDHKKHHGQHTKHEPSTTHGTSADASGNLNWEEIARLRGWGPQSEVKPGIDKPEDNKPDEDKKADEDKKTNEDKTPDGDDKPEGDKKPEDETKPDETKPDESKPENESKPDERKPDESKPDESKPDESKPDESKPENEIKPAENGKLGEEIKPEEDKKTDEDDKPEDIEKPDENGKHQPDNDQSNHSNDTKASGSDKLDNESENQDPTGSYPGNQGQFSQPSSSAKLDDGLDTQVTSSPHAIQSGPLSSMDNSSPLQAVKQVQDMPAPVGESNDYFESHPLSQSTQPSGVQREGSVAGVGSETRAHFDPVNAEGSDVSQTAHRHDNSTDGPQSGRGFVDSPATSFTTGSQMYNVNNSLDTNANANVLGQQRTAEPASAAMTGMPAGGSQDPYQEHAYSSNNHSHTENKGSSRGLATGAVLGVVGGAVLAGGVAHAFSSGESHSEEHLSPHPGDDTEYNQDIEHSDHGDGPTQAGYPGYDGETAMDLPLDAAADDGGHIYDHSAASTETGHDDDENFVPESHDGDSEFDEHDSRSVTYESDPESQFSQGYNGDGAAENANDDEFNWNDGASTEQHPPEINDADDSSDEQEGPDDENTNFDVTDPEVNGGGYESSEHADSENGDPYAGIGDDYDDEANNSSDQEVDGQGDYFEGSGDENIEDDDAVNDSATNQGDQSDWQEEEEPDEDQELGLDEDAESDQDGHESVDEDISEGDDQGPDLDSDEESQAIQSDQDNEDSEQASEEEEDELEVEDDEPEEDDEPGEEDNEPEEEEDQEEEDEYQEEEEEYQEEEEEEQEDVNDEPDYEGRDYGSDNGAQTDGEDEDEEQLSEGSDSWW